MQLLERKDSLDVLSQLVTDVSAGEGKTVLLSGEAGIGKTSLIKCFTNELYHFVKNLSSRFSNVKEFIGELRSLFNTLG